MVGSSKQSARHAMSIWTWVAVSGQLKIKTKNLLPLSVVTYVKDTQRISAKPLLEL